MTHVFKYRASERVQAAWAHEGLEVPVPNVGPFHLIQYTKINH